MVRLGPSRVHDSSKRPHPPSRRLVVTRVHPEGTNSRPGRTDHARPGPPEPPAAFPAPAANRLLAVDVLTPIAWPTSGSGTWAKWCSVNVSPLLGGQAGQQFVHQFGEQLAVRQRRRVLGGPGQRVEQFPVAVRVTADGPHQRVPAPPAAGVDHQVPPDPVHPPAEPAQRQVVPVLPVHLQQRFLREILRPGPVPHVLQEEPQQRPPVPGDQLVERRPVARLQPDHGAVVLVVLPPAAGAGPRDRVGGGDGRGRVGRGRVGDGLGHRRPTGRVRSRGRGGTGAGPGTGSGPGTGAGPGTEPGRGGVDRPPGGPTIAAPTVPIEANRRPCQSPPRPPSARRN